MDNKDVNLHPQNLRNFTTASTLDGKEQRRNTYSCQMTQLRAQGQEIQFMDSKSTINSSRYCILHLKPVPKYILFRVFWYLLPLYKPSQFTIFDI